MGRYDERSYGPLCVPQDSDQPSEGKGGGKGVEVKGADSLEEGPSQQARPNKVAFEGVASASRGAEEDSQGQGGRDLEVKGSPPSG